MRTDIRLQLDMAQRVLEFERAHATTPGAEPKLPAELEALLARAQALTGEQRDGILGRKTAIGKRKEVKAMLHTKLVPYLVRVAGKAADELPALSGVFRNTYLAVPDRVFANDVRRMLDAAKANAELFAKNGLTAEVMDELTATFAEFEQLIADTTTARLSHVGASAELLALRTEVRELVRRLDGWNRFRFRDNPVLLVEWKSATKVLKRSRPEEAAGEPTAPAGPAGPAAGTDVNPKAA